MSGTLHPIPRAVVLAYGAVCVVPYALGVILSTLKDSLPDQRPPVYAWAPGMVAALLLIGGFLLRAALRRRRQSTGLVVWALTSQVVPVAISLGTLAMTVMVQFGYTPVINLD